MLSCRPALLACLALLACSGGNKPLGLLGADCAKDRDAACSSGQCLALDSSTAYCTQGFLCAQAASVSGKVCQSVGAGGVCGVDDDCPAGLKCDAAAAR